MMADYERVVREEEIAGEHEDSADDWRTRGQFEGFVMGAVTMLVCGLVLVVVFG